MHGVKGFRVGGKTGTSEDGVNTNKYITSFMGLSPTDEPELVILVVLYNPTGEGGHHGGAWVILTTFLRCTKQSELQISYTEYTRKLLKNQGLRELGN